MGPGTWGELAPGVEEGRRGSCVMGPGTWGELELTAEACGLSTSQSSLRFGSPGRGLPSTATDSEIPEVCMHNVYVCVGVCVGVCGCVWVCVGVCGWGGISSGRGHTWIT